MRETINSIRELRLSQRPPLRQVDLAVRLGVDRSEVSRYENGTVMPTLRRAIEIALVFRVPVERVFHGLVNAAESRDEESTGVDPRTGVQSRQRRCR